MAERAQKFQKNGAALRAARVRFTVPRRSANHFDSTLHQDDMHKS